MVVGLASPVAASDADPNDGLEDTAESCVGADSAADGELSARDLTRQTTAPQTTSAQTHIAAMTAIAVPR